MRLGALAVREVTRRRLGFALSVLAAAVATAAYVSVETLSRSSQDAMRRVMLKLGHNILIVPHGAPPERIWTAQFGEYEMPEAMVDELAADRRLQVEHYAARLQRRVDLSGVTGILTGVRAITTAADRAEAETLGFEFADPYDVQLGADLAQALGRDAGDTVTVGGRTFTVAAVREPRGSADDIRLYAPLSTVQAMYDKAGRIDSIAALARVGFGMDDPLKTIRGELAGVLGQRADVIVETAPFQMRDKSRRMLRTLGGAVAVTLLALCGLGLALYVYHNVSERRYETAVLVALGYRPWQVAGALLGKVAVIGTAAGVLGLVAGTAVATVAGPFIVAVDAVRPVWALWWQALAYALALCLAAAGVAVWGAVGAQPADVLRNQ